MYANIYPNISSGKGSTVAPYLEKCIQEARSTRTLASSHFWNRARSEIGKLGGGGNAPPLRLSLVQELGRGSAAKEQARSYFRRIGNPKNE